MKAFKSCSLDVKVFVPAGGYFMLLDVSNVKVDEKYKANGESHDEAVAQYLIHEKGLALIPLRSFYIDQETSPKCYLRIALCKDEPTTIKACKIIANL